MTTSAVPVNGWTGPWRQAVEVTSRGSHASRGVESSQLKTTIPCINDLQRSTTKSPFSDGRKQPISPPLTELTENRQTPTHISHANYRYPGGTILPSRSLGQLSSFIL